ncbi:MAG: 4-hydroxy-tetrahydrodipicolinate reductase, partial [Bacteroidia bacterium]|nr:4-hydroxy-tetrahydrodipicolinate reductase [Bacteroidia bacterium]
MKIALIGYGKMGKEIESLAKARGNEIVLIVDENNVNTIVSADLQKADVAIEFSAPSAAIGNIYKCFDAGIPVVVGTTGWYTKLDEVKKKQAEKSSGLFYASNFSVGVNLFFEVNKYLAAMMNKYPDYEVSIEEQHHIHKKDAPSGTGITIAEGILQNFSSKKRYTIEKSDNKEDLFIEVVREG